MQVRFLGIAGVSGNGQSELTNILSGTLKPTSGKISLEDQDLTGAEPITMTQGRCGQDRGRSTCQSCG